ncbi:hypothetical protein BC831DRAFT_450206 [Entophlyctis helioformis]|nr:hypothetical protein BC831DRAFT_450206 [Entophlyctis helioformis]
MVVLAASICTKAGKAVLSRQFVEMSRSRIEGLIASFPKLIGASDQHTYVETDSVRYVYQPLESLFMVLVTTKNSNILQDIDTLHLFARVVSEYCRSNDEREIAKQAFDLLLVFDEIIALGYRENVNLGQIRTISAMESHDERVQAEIERTKEKEAKEELKRKAKMLDQQRRDMAKSGYAPRSGYGGFGAGGAGGGGGSGGFSSGGSGGYGAGAGVTSPGSGPGTGGFSSTASVGAGYGQASAGYGQQTSGSFGAQTSAPAPSAPATMARGMQLGGSSARQNVVLDSINAFEGIQKPAAAPSAAAPSQAHAAPAAAVRQESVHLVVEEKISVTANRDGGIQGVEVNGSMMLKINDAAAAQVRLSVSHASDPNLRFTTHPKVDKDLWASNSVIGLRDPAGAYPVGQALGILRWKSSSRSESDVPLTINCWPSPTGNGACDVNIEYELQNTRLELHDVVISIPYPGNNPPTVGDVEGHYQIDRQRRVVVWSLPLIDTSNSSGVLEFQVASEDVSAFYPIQVAFRSTQLLNPIQIAGAATADGGAPRFSVEKSLQTDAYQVV